MRELEDFENSMSESHVRGHHVPAPTPLLKDIADFNKLDLHKKEARQLVRIMLDDLRTTAPVVHISFAVEPDVKFITDIAKWFREEIAPNIVLQIGVQPSIGVGCVVRTTNKFFDFSLRKHLVDSSDLFKQRIEGVA
jgi:F0F1-type ATP synthase delta subunit